MPLFHSHHLLYLNFFLILINYARNKARKSFTIPTCFAMQNFLEYSKKNFNKKREVIGYEITKNSPKMALVYT